MSALVLLNLLLRGAPSCQILPENYTEGFVLMYY